MKGGLQMKKMMKALSTAVIAIALAGCGTTANTNEDEDTNTGSENDNSGIVAGSMVPSLTEEVKDGNHQYVFQLKNDKAEDVTLTMNSSMFFDYQLIDSNGTVVYQDSDNKMYTQMLQEKTLKPGEVLEMKIDATEGLAKLPAGTYTLEAWSTANEAEDWKASTEVTWDGATTNEDSTNEKLKVEEATVTYVGRQDLNSIEVTNEQNEPEAMRLADVAKPFFDELAEGTKITVSYVIIDGQKVIQSAISE
jgi:outer membrane protein assembly factor BamE (lipoprotein component of BamABCDE complex)